MRVLLVVNPVATMVTDDLRAVVAKALAEDHELEVVETSARGHGVVLAAKAAATGTEVVVAMGGDGSVNEVANGLACTATAFAALPGGSTNVFARTAGFDRDPLRAIDQLVASLARGARLRVGLGVANGRYFTFHAGVGFDAQVIEQVEKRSSLKRRFGQAAFVSAGLATWFGQQDRARPRFTVTVGGGEAGGTGGAGEAFEGAFAICLKTDPYTFLGPRPLTITSEVGYGTGLGLLVVPDLRATTLTGAIVAALGTGRRLGEIPGFALRTGLETVTVTAARPVPYQVDGDFVGQSDRIELSHRPNCLDIVPA